MSGFSFALSEALPYLVIGIPVSYLVAVIPGIPMFALASKLRWTKAWQAAILGAVVALLIPALYLAFLGVLVRIVKMPAEKRE